jgi:hypothetical protein
MTYQLDGRLLEVCDCNVLCPCWIGEDPDNGTCQSIAAWHIDQGAIEGTDVSGLTYANLAFLPGNALKGNWRVVVAIDDHATPQQQQALLNAFRGKLGGPLADLANLVGEVVAVECLPITFTVADGNGRITIGTRGEAQLAPYIGATGQPTTLHDTLFSTIPGSPAYVGKADFFRLQVPELGIDLNLTGNNAIQGQFHFAV